MKMKMTGRRWKQLFILPSILLLSLFATSCRVEKTSEGEMPDVDVEVESGELPEYDVEGPDVEVGTTEKTIEVPTVDVDLPDGEASDENTNEAAN